MFALLFVLLLVAIFSTQAAVVPYVDDEALTLESIPHDIFYAINKVAVFANINIAYNLSLTSKTLRKAIVEFARVANNRSIDEVLIGMRFLNQILVQSNRADAQLYQELLRRTRVSPNNLALIPSHIQESVNISYWALPSPGLLKHLVSMFTAMIAGIYVLPSGYKVDALQMRCTILGIIACYFASLMHFFNESGGPNRTVERLLKYERLPVLMLQHYAVFQMARASCEMGACSREKRFGESVLFTVPSCLAIYWSELPLHMKFVTLAILLLVSIDF